MCVVKISDGRSVKVPDSDDLRFLMLPPRETFTLSAKRSDFAEAEDALVKVCLDAEGELRSLGNAAINTALDDVHRVHAVSKEAFTRGCTETAYEKYLRQNDEYYLGLVEKGSAVFVDEGVVSDE